MSNALLQSAHKEVARCVVTLLLREPFFGHLLGGLVRNFSSPTPTAAVALTQKGVELWINPDFFMGRLDTHEERVAVIKHEALHLLYKHLFRVDPQTRDLRLFNLAADLVVNQFVAPWRLPDGAILLSTFPDLNLEQNRTLDYYYERLAELMDELSAIKMQAASNLNSSASAESKPSDPTSTNPTNSRSNGEGSQSNSEAFDYSQTSAPKSAKTLDRLAGSSWHSDHSGWSAARGGGEGQSAHGGAIPDALIDGLKGELERQIIQAKDRTDVRSWARLSGLLRAEIDLMIERRKPQISWKRVLRLFSASSRRTRMVATSHRRSKRFGTFPGIKSKRYQRMAVAIDTSGSVSDDDLSRFFAEIHAIWKRGAEILVIECDADVQRSYLYKGTLPTTITGRGGTRYNPVFQWLRDRRRERFDGCIYLTDGDAAKPSIRPPCPLLWVVTSDGFVGEHLTYGRTIQLPKD